MADPAREPSMEDILASIKRLIAEDGAQVPPRPTVRRGSLQAVANEPEEVLELTQPVDAPAPETARVEEAYAPPPVAPAAATPPRPIPPPLVSDRAAAASREALSALSAMIVTGPGQDNTLDGLVREMLRPLLKEWLDARLPELVEGLVAREIARITGRAL